MFNVQFSMLNVHLKNLLGLKQLLITNYSLLILLSSCSIQQKISKSAKQVINDSSLLTAHVGISIYEPATGKYWYNYQGDKYFVPASNTKIPTCYAAMKYLGDSLVGLMYGTTDQPGKVLIKGTGDPTFLHPDFKHQPVYDFLKRQNQPIVITDPNFFAVTLGSGWAWNDYNEYYMAERSGLPVYGNISTWMSIGKSPSNLYDFAVTPKIFRDSLPQPYIDYTTILSQGKPHSDYDFELRRNKSSNVFELLPANSRFRTAQIPFETSNRNTLAHILSDTLELPVSSGGKLTIYNHPVIKSQPIDSLLKPMMHRSDNFFAEQSLLMVSNQKLGLMSDAMVIDTILKTDFKDLPQRPRWADGSGLSRYNLFTPQDFVTILNKMKNEFGMERIKIILPTGGEGTISTYYKADSNYIFAKTGTLSGVVALSGFLYTEKGKLLIFSVLVNNHQASATAVRRAVERFIHQLRIKN